MQVLRNDFLPDDIIAELQQNGIDGTVAVQADQSEMETDFLLELAAEYDIIKGVVGWVNLRAENLNERLQHYKQYSRLKGFRHILQGENNRALMLEPDFKQGIGILAKYGFTYDILILADQLPYANELVKAFPHQKFVVDHIAKPQMKNKENDAQWAAGITALAQNQNVWCKLSGLVTEGDWRNWKNGDYKFYLDTVISAFGIERCMYGSDWPVSLLAASYHEVKNIIDEYSKGFSVHEKALLFGGNAIKFYDL